VLSSNFRNGSKDDYGEPEHTPGKLQVRNITFDISEMQNITISEYIFLLYLKSHGMYWSGNPKEISFFTNYITALRAEGVTI